MNAFRGRSVLRRWHFLIFTLLVSTTLYAQDPNFHIYLCFGQSNMEGQGTIEARDKTVDERFQVLQAVDCSNMGRSKNEWYAAIPPLTRCYSGLSPADYFGRTMVENLPDSIRVGIVNVSVAGCRIELFDKENYESYASGVEQWMKNIIAAYDGNPYQYLVDAAKVAQESGVIKGILLHQGESNTGDNAWPGKVKGVYDNLLSDLALQADQVPLLAGEVVHADQGGICASMNGIIAKLPQSIPNAYVISSSGCTDSADNLHFNSAGYRKLGIRYAIQMLSLMGIDIQEPEEPEVPEGTEAVYLEAECAESIGGNWEVVENESASNGDYVAVVQGIQSLDGATSDDESIQLPFSVDTTGTFDLYARLNCPTADDDSYWMKIDAGNYQMFNGLGTAGWQWVKLESYTLEAGEHTLFISYREDGALLDKLCFTNYSTAPDGLGADAGNLCDVNTPGVGTNDYMAVDGYALNQIYPNPFVQITNIGFVLPVDEYVSLKITDIRGVEIVELAGKVYEKGSHTIQLDAGDLSRGTYICSMTTQHFTKSTVLIKQ